MSEKYGNDDCWVFLEPETNPGEIAVWRSIDGSPYIVCRAVDKWDAKYIVDAIIAFSNNTVKGILVKKELVFLEFVKSKCPEPYATMAANALLWNDKDTYKKLLCDFPVIY
jgi:hypothetical protein